MGHLGGGAGARSWADRLRRSTPPNALRHARSGGVLTGLTATTTGVVLQLLRPRLDGADGLTVLAVVVLVAAIVAAQLPWDHLPRPALALFPVLTMAQLSVVGWIAGPRAGAVLTGFLVLVFLYTGSVAQRSEVVLLAVPATLTWLVLTGVARIGFTQETAIRLPIALTVWLAAGLVTAAHASEQRRQQLLLVGDASTDPLTGLGNRRLLDPALQWLKSGDAVVVIDIDDFRAVNTRRGHSGADVVLAEFGQLVRIGLRGGDLAARTGGDEFVLLLADVDAHRVEVVLCRIREGWQRTCGDVSFSAGAAFRRLGETGDQTLVRADRNCYRAKEGGRDRWVLTEPRATDVGSGDADSPDTSGPPVPDRHPVGDTVAAGR